MKKLFNDPTVRLAGRALITAVGVVCAKYLTGDTTGRALIVAGLLAFAEIFTPLNSLVGVFKNAAK